ncbi:MAG: glutamate racemase [Bacteriovoracaceae bacterium]|nr:glutamate racemase [Bacteriovoracaceae bacterium]
MKKVGIIDSGIGGLSILSHLLAMQGQCEFYYQSDHSNVPYGGKAQDFMLAQTLKMIDKLVEKQVELIIVACNTLTVETIDILRKTYPIPFVGIEPFVNFINTDLYKGDEKVGLILTPATSKSPRFNELKVKLDPKNMIEVVPLHRLALIIEEMGSTGIDNHIQSLEEELFPLKDYGFDILLYGCTHYPLISKLISKFLDVEVYDPHIAVSKRVLKLLNVQVDSVENHESVNFNYASEIADDWSKKQLKDFCFFN